MCSRRQVHVTDMYIITLNIRSPGYFYFSLEFLKAEPEIWMQIWYISWEVTPKVKREKTIEGKISIVTILGNGAQTPPPRLLTHLQIVLKIVHLGNGRQEHLFISSHIPACVKGCSRVLIPLHCQACMPKAKQAPFPAHGIGEAPKQRRSPRQPIPASFCQLEVSQQLLRIAYLPTAQVRPKAKRPWIAFPGNQIQALPLKGGTQTGRVVQQANAFPSCIVLWI